MVRLTKADREHIEFYLHCKQGVREIGKLIRKDHSVVSREIRRNSSPFLPYSAKTAQAAADRKAKLTDQMKLVKHRELAEYVTKKLRKDWSPEQIAGRLKEFPDERPKGLTVSHEAIYGWIYEHEPHLYHKLRYKKPDRQKQGSRKHQNKPLIPEMVSITERPEAINERKEVGHFESDSLVGKGRKQGLSVQYERAIQLSRIHKILGFNATETKDALVATIESLPNDFTKSFTFDRGGESAKHYELRAEYELQTFHCEAYKPWQKGGVENCNGLIRQYFPKGTDFTIVTDYEIRRAQELLNNRPRKGLNYRTPNEKLQEFIQSGALKA